MTWINNWDRKSGHVSFQNFTFVSFYIISCFNLSNKVKILLERLNWFCLILCRNVILKTQISYSLPLNHFRPFYIILLGKYLQKDYILLQHKWTNISLCRKTNSRQGWKMDSFHCFALTSEDVILTHWFTTNSN